MIVSLMTLLLVGCGDEPQTTTGKTEASTQVQEVVEKKAKVEPPKPAQEPLMGDLYPVYSLLKHGFGKTRMEILNQTRTLRIWRSKVDGWERIRLEDSDSNVFHKAIPFQNGMDHWCRACVVKTLDDAGWSLE